MWEAWNTTDHAVHERQQRDKRRLDAARDKVVYKVGDLVAYARPIDQRHHKMLMPYFTAVYQIEEKRERDNYKLCMLGGKPIRGKWDGVVHVSQLKPHPGSHLISRIVRGELHEFVDIVKRDDDVTIDDIRPHVASIGSRSLVPCTALHACF